MAEYKSIYTGEQIDTAIGKANTALQTELEPAFNASVSKDITSQDITNWNAKAELSDIPDVSNFITKDVNNLTNYELKTNTGATIELTINSSTYEMTLNLKNSAGTTISTGNVDLPLETMVVGATYDNNNKKIILELKNGTTLDVPVGDLINGLQSEITSSNKLDASLVDDSLSTNKFTNSTEKTTWNSKYDKPSTGIPKTDLAQAVQNILDDVSNKEDTSNKVSTIDAQSTNTQYAGAKAVWDLISSLGSDLGVGYLVGNQEVNFSDLKPGVYLFRSSSGYFKYKTTNSQSKTISNIIPILLIYYEDVNEIGTPSATTPFALLMSVSNTTSYLISPYPGLLAMQELKINTQGEMENGTYSFNNVSFLTGGNQEIKGEKIFSTVPQLNPGNVYTITNNNQLVHKQYVDDSVSKYSTMPTASANNLGKIVQYIGTTDSTYINGYFYKCVSDGQTTPTYSWEKEPTITMNVTYTDNTTATFELKGRELV